MPAVAVRSSPNGLPIATAVSPTFTRARVGERERRRVRRVADRVDLQRRRGRRRGRCRARRRRCCGRSAPKRTATWRGGPTTWAFVTSVPRRGRTGSRCPRRARCGPTRRPGWPSRRSRRSAFGPAAPGRAGAARACRCSAGRPPRRPRRAGARSPSRRRTARGRAGCAAARARAAATADFVAASAAPAGRRGGPASRRSTDASGPWRTVAGVPKGWVMSGPPQVYPSVGMNSSDADKGC